MTPVRIPIREAILEAALMVYQEQPGSSLSVIAERAGVGRATLHRHFPSRDALMRELAHMSIRAIDDAVAGLPEQAESAAHLLRQQLEAIIPLGDRFHFLSTEAQLMNHVDVYREVMRQYKNLSNVIEQAKAEGAIEESIPTDWIVGVIDSLIYTAWSIRAMGSVANNQIPDLVNRTIFHGFSPGTNQPLPNPTENTHESK